MDKLFFILLLAITSTAVAQISSSSSAVPSTSTTGEGAAETSGTSSTTTSGPSSSTTEDSSAETILPVKSSIDHFEHDAAKMHGNFSIEILPPLLTRAEIDAIARRSAAALTRPTFQHMKQLFAQFAPDTWVEALDDIPLPTIRCVTKVATKIRLRQQQHFLRAKFNLTEAEEADKEGDQQIDAENEDVISDGSDRRATATTEPTTTPEDSENELDSAEVDEIQTQEQMMEVLKSMCPRGFAQMVALNEAINETFRAMPADVRKILEEYSARAKNMSGHLSAGEMNVMKPMLMEFIEKLKAISTEDREKMGDLFPKLREVFTDARLDELLDMSIKCINGTMEACKSATKLSMQIWISGTSSSAAASKHNSDTPKKHGFVKLRAKRQHESADPLLEVPDVNKETD